MINPLIPFQCCMLCLQGAMCLARSLKVVNEALASLNLGFNEIRVCNLISASLQLCKY